MKQLKNPTYRRLPEEQRKQLIIDATLECLSCHSLSGTTVRRIADMASVTPGLVTHHFKSKEELIAESYRYLAEKFLFDYRFASESITGNEIEKLKAFISAMFQPESLDRDVLRIWTGFWTLVLFDKRLESVHKSTAKKTRTYLSALIKAALISVEKPVDGDKVSELSIAILSLLDGMWLALGLDQNLLKVEDARRLAFEMISARLQLPEILEIDNY